MATISIVVPVYNVEKYICSCIESILNQTYKDYELILVDDGSKDSSPHICEMYAKKDKRIKVLHKQNGGLSDARNAGTELASGEYITYIDGDDYVNPLCLEMLLKAIIETEADFSLVDLKKTCSLNEDESIKKYDINIRKVSAVNALSLVLYQNFHDVSASGLLLPLRLAKKHPFPVGKLFEDLFTTYKYYLDVSNVAIVDAKLYYYLQRSNSIMDGDVTPKYVDDLLEASDNIVDSCKEFSELIRAAENKKFSNYCSLMKNGLNGISQDKRMKVEKYLKSIKFEIIQDGNARLKNRAAAIIICLGFPLLRCMYYLESLRNKRVEQ